LPGPIVSRYHRDGSPSRAPCAAGGLANSDAGRDMDSGGGPGITPGRDYFIVPSDIFKLIETTNDQYSPIFFNRIDFSVDWGIVLIVLIVQTNDRLRDTPIPFFIRTDAPLRAAADIDHFPWNFFKIIHGKIIQYIA
jgi:hypothetical protein